MSYAICYLDKTKLIHEEQTQLRGYEDNNNNSNNSNNVRPTNNNKLDLDTISRE